MVMVGADIAQLRRTAQELEAGAQELDEAAAQLAGLLGSFAWLGRAAVAFTDTFLSVRRPRMTTTAAYLRDAAQRLRHEADEQERASGPTRGPGSHHGPGGTVPGERYSQARVDAALRTVTAALDTGGLGVTRSDLETVKAAFAELGPAEQEALLRAMQDRGLVAVLRDQMQEGWAKGGWSHAQQADFYQLFEGNLPALRILLGDDYPSVEGWRSADAATSSNGLIIGLMEEQGVGHGEIVIRDCGNGRYVVFLPGIEDFDLAYLAASEARPGAVARTAGLTIGGAVLGGPLGGAVGGLIGMGMAFDQPGLADTGRDMRWAQESAMANMFTTGDSSQNPSQNWQNPYAVQVKLAMQEAGIPPGSEVLLAGHSFGAYTAMELAADPTFNGAGGEGSYHVEVRGVVAMAADADWMMSDVAAQGTPGVLINNTNDLAARGESLLGRDADGGVPPGWQVRTFDGGLSGAGHGGGNYVDYLQGSDLPGVVDDFVGGASESARVTHARTFDMYR